MRKVLILLAGLLMFAGCSDFKGFVYPNGINNETSNFSQLGDFNSWDECEMAGYKAINNLNSKKSEDEVMASFECAKNCKPYGDLYNCKESKIYNED